MKELEALKLKYEERFGEWAKSFNTTNRLDYQVSVIKRNINKFAKNMLARDTRVIRDYIKSISPDLDLKYDFTSEITGETEALDIPFGISFFYPTN